MDWIDVVQERGQVAGCSEYGNEGLCFMVVLLRLTKTIVSQSLSEAIPTSRFVKGNIHHRIRHSSTLSLSSALDWVGG